MSDDRGVVLVEGFGADASGAARHLAARGRSVVVAGPGLAPPEILALRDLGVEVRERTDLDASADVYGTIVVDCWTAETAPRVRRHRAAGSRVTSIGQLVLEHSPVPVIGVTGSGGKTTATRLVARMLRASGIAIAESTTARAGNAWPTAELLGPSPREGWAAVELTSTHLAYMSQSPAVAVVTSFWPDHSELHGDLGAYRAAKAVILDHQAPTDWCVLNRDDAGAASFAGRARGGVLWASAERAVDAGIGVERGRVLARISGRCADLGPRSALAHTGPVAGVAMTAACAALLSGADPEAVAGALAEPIALPHRGEVVGRVGRVEVIDHSAATTPRKARAALEGRNPARVVAIVGGERSLGGTAVHGSAEERGELAQALEAFAACRAVVSFGAAGEGLPSSGHTATVEAATRAALDLARPGDTVILAPMFPVDLADRGRFGRFVAGLGSGAPATGGRRVAD